MNRWLSRDGWSSMRAAAPKAELEQAFLRVLIGGTVLLVVLLILIWSLLRQGHADTELAHMALFLCGFVSFAVAMVFQILAKGGTSKLRRLLGSVADNAGTTYFMLLMGEGGAIVVGIFMFVAFGNGFRYGRLYLHVSQALALVGFSIVILVSDFWRQHWLIALGIWLALFFLPFYVGVLASRISEEKKRADEANQAKDRFLANVSHEMRTPLNGVIAMADLLRETRLNSSQREIVQTLGTSAQLALVQIEDVLDMAKLQAGGVRIEVRPFDFGKLLTDTVKVILPQARYKKLEVNTDISVDAARWFAGDSHHIRQVLLNLLSNAVKFTETGQIVLSARVLRSVGNVSTLRIEVRDTGIGIEPIKKGEIFEPFAQADDSVTRLYGGTGLGTTIAKQLIGLMGGTIGLESTLGSGSTFWVELPLERSDPKGIDLVQELTANARASSAMAHIGMTSAANVHKMRGARILVAEDNSTNQRVTQMILESGGYVTTIVNNGEEALDALEKGGFHLALFDLSMPGVSGLEALKLYRFVCPTPIPVLILSASVTSEAISQCQAAGAAEFVPKPVRPSLLLDAIDRHLAGESLKGPLVPPPRAEERPTLAVVDTPLLDRGVLSDIARISNDPTFVERLIDGFRSDSLRLASDISEALAKRKYEAVKDAAHALRGGAGSIGATQLIQFAQRLERSTHEILRLKSSQWTDELHQITQLTNKALQEHLQQRRRQDSAS
jgi:two-component system sensor histidine kinase RpfC